MTEKEEFIEKLKKRTKTLAVEIIYFCNSLKTCTATSVITYQLVKSSTSTGANYRAACRARSKAEFYSKICIVVEEADLSNNKKELERLLVEANEITRIMTKAKNSSYGNK